MQMDDMILVSIDDHMIEPPNMWENHVPQKFLDHGSRDEILDAAGLSAQHLARQLTETVARRTPGAAAPGVADAPGTARVSEDRLPE